MVPVNRSHGDRATERGFVFLCGVVPVIVVVALALFRPAFLQRAESSAYDSVLRRTTPNRPDGRVTIVDIDERSLAAIGQWPWRRDLVGRLITRLGDLGASIVAVDLIFAEPDRFEASPGVVGMAGGDAIPTPHALTASDAYFAGALGRSGVVLGYALTFEQGATGRSECILHPLDVAIVQPPEDGGHSPLFRASNAICSLPMLARAARASGFLNTATDADGILRRAPLLIDLDGRVYPGLALAAVLAATGTESMALRVVNANTTTLTLDGGIVPLDGRGNLLVRYRGRNKTFRYVSAVDVLEGRLPARALKDHIVFVGATALGTGDAVATPIDTRFNGVELHATVADNLLQRDFIHRPEFAAAIEAQATLAGGITVALVAARLGLSSGIAAALFCVIVLWGGSLWRLAAAGEFLSPLYPTLGLLAALPATTTARLVVERRRVHRAQHETAVSQHLMVQGLLSLTEARHAETGQHARRTRQYTHLLAEQLANHPRFRRYLTPERIDLLATLAPLHDIGKVAIPDRLLTKPGALTGEELAEMRNHPAYGLDVILEAEKRAGSCNDPILAMAKDIVYTHHERWDGTGYPRGLTNDEIPIPGRLVAVVDVYDALVTKRVYRQPISPEAALNLIVAGRGTLFDPAVVDAFLEVFPAFSATLPEPAHTGQDYSPA